MFASFRTLAALALFAPAIALACEDTMTITGLEVNALPGVNAAAYPTFTSEIDDTVLGASSPAAKAVELHTHLKDGDIMRMRKVESVSLKAGVPTVFESGGLHVMFIGLKKPLKAGDTIPVTFRFAHATKQTVTFTATAPHLHEATDSLKHHH